MSLDHENIGRGRDGMRNAIAIAIVAFTIAIAIAGVKVVTFMMMMMMRMHIRRMMGHHGSRSEFSEIWLDFVSIFDLLGGHGSITLLQTRGENRAHVLAFRNVEDSGT
jgi:hypothetical protein